MVKRDHIPSYISGKNFIQYSIKQSIFQRRCLDGAPIIISPTVIYQLKHKQNFLFIINEIYKCYKILYETHVSMIFIFVYIYLTCSFPVF